MNYESNKELYSIKQYDGTKIPITRNEIEKVVEAMRTNSIVVLKCAVIRGNSISTILRDVEGEHGRITEKDAPLPRGAYLTSLPTLLNKEESFSDNDFLELN